MTEPLYTSVDATQLTDVSECGKYFLYFAYGSNLLAERIHVNNPSAEYVATARLENFALGFSDFSPRWQGAGATIYPSIGDHVCGVVWKVNIDDSEHLDSQEHRYHRAVVPVTCCTSSARVYHCRTYQMKDVISGDHLPSPHYLHVIVEGAKEHNLPSDYIEMLKRCATNGYVGPTQMNLTVLRELNAQTPKQNT